MAVVSKVKIKADDKGVAQTVDRVTRKFNNAERQIQGFGRGIGGSLSSISGIMSNLSVTAGLAITGVVTGLGYLVKSTIDTAEHLQKMSQRVGVSAEALSTLSYAAELSGTDIGVFEKAIQRLSRNVDDASRGIGDGRKAFDDLSISVIKADGSLVDAETIIKEVADKFGSMEDGTKKTALALKIFGRAGADLIPMLNGGAAGLEDMQQKARDLGLEIATNTANEAAELKDSMLNLNRSLNGIANETMPFFVYGLSNMLDGIVDVTKAIKGSDGLIEAMYAMNVNAIMEGVQNAMREHKAALNEAIALAENQARASAKGKTDDQIKSLIQDQIKVIEALKKLDLDENIENTIRQKEAQLKIYQGLVNINDETEKQKRLAESLAKQWSTVEQSLNMDIAKASMSDFELQIYAIEQKVEQLNEKFGDKQIITEYGEVLTDALIGRMVDGSMAEAIAEEEALMNRQMEMMDEDLLHSIEVSNIKKDLIREEIELKRRQEEEEEERQRRRVQSYADSFSNMSQAANIFYQLSNKQSKSAFQAYKAFSIAEAAISAYAAANAALLPPPVGLGPIWGIPLAATTVAVGLANVARISAMTPGSSGGGFGSGGTPHTLPTNNYNSSVNNNNQQIITNIYVSDWQEFDADSMVREKIVPALEKYVGYGGRININGGL